MTFIVDGTNGLTFPNSTVQASAGSVLQVVQAVKTDTFSSTTGSFVDITGVSVSITPKFSTSKILVLSTVGIGGNAPDQVTLRLVRNSTAIFVGDTAGSRSLGYYGIDTFILGTTAVLPQSIAYLDSPATTSATTYKIQGKTGTNVWYVNRSAGDEDASYRTRTASSIIVMEIAA
jgi:hypothetical protein